MTGLSLGKSFVSHESFRDNNFSALSYMYHCKINFVLIVVACVFHPSSSCDTTILKCKNIFTKMLKDVGIEVPKSIETRSKFSMHADKGRG